MTITIIGGGVSGTLLAINLIKNHKSGLKINIIEKDKDKFNLGIAYHTSEITHLLNVRAIGMSIFKDEPEHFINWLNNNGYSYTKTDFVPRSIFGKYVQYYYNQYASKTDVKVNVIFDEVVNLHQNDKWFVELTTQSLVSDKVVLALGHISIAEMDMFKYTNISKYFRTPWVNNIFDSIKPTDDVLMIGSGLTSDDIILSLKSRNHTGKIYCISRRGLQPFNHEIFEPYPSFYSEIEGKDINTIFSIVKSHLKVAKNPRAVIDSLRPHTQTIWKSLSISDKSRFLRHVNALWNVIRHRMPESTFDTLSQMESDGQLKFLTGRINSIKENDRISINYYNRLNSNNVIVDVIINCIGPESNYKRIKMPLISNLLESGIVENNDNGITIKVDNYKIKDNLYVIGPLLKGELFEATAVPEIRIQAEELSKML